MNYGDLINWGLDDPDDVKIHLHFIGRAKEQIHQMRARSGFLKNNYVRYEIE